MTSKLKTSKMDQPIPLTQNFNLFQFCQSLTPKTRVIVGRLKGEKQLLDYLWSQPNIAGVIVVVVGVLSYSLFFLPSSLCHDSPISLTLGFDMWLTLTNGRWTQQWKFWTEASRGSECFYSPSGILLSPMKTYPKQPWLFQYRSHSERYMKRTEPNPLSRVTTVNLLTHEQEVMIWMQAIEIIG